ncbi:carbohydrate kinase family protein [Aestuariimicrobium ganziense]|uniref:carbohydrate kinase family protein n=1 Tax=Aestuariimicrobium ganziense TaxID=2773677 RepID=UPI001943B19D|nr:PfkB family carbohydrate kinase [Aestuariimicrobium ganziense]
MATVGHRHDVACHGLYFNDMIFSGLPDDGLSLGCEHRTAAYLSVPGGIANASIASARLGLRTAMVSDVGDDVVGQGSLVRLRQEGIDTDGCLVHEGWQTPLTVILNYHGDRTMVTAETPHPGRCVLRQQTPPAARVVIAHLQPFTMPWLMAAGASGGLVIGSVGWDESGRWDLDRLPDLRHCHAFTPNLTEALHYTRSDDPERALDALLDHVPLAVITLGGDGAMAADRRTGERVRVPAIPGRFVDASGAGDVFGAGLAAGLVAGWTLERKIRFAVLVSGLTVQRPGSATTSPTLGELRIWHDQLNRDDPLVEQYDFLSEISTHGAWS